MIEILRGYPDNVVALAVHGDVTKQDYEEVLIPAVERTLQSHDTVRLLYEIGPGFESYDFGAVWEDFKVGMEHLSRWERVAVITDLEWIRLAVQFISVFLPGTVRVYPNDEATKARIWITQAS